MSATVSDSSPFAMAPSATSPPKAVYVKSKVAVASGIEENNPEERTLVAGAQYRIRSSSTAASRLSIPIHLFVVLKRMLTGSSAKDNNLKVPPVLILPFLALGNEYNAAKYDELYALGITHICNLDFTSRNYFEGKFIYVKLNIVDRPEENLLHHFDPVNQFLEAAEAVGGRAFLHCAAGHALSPSFVVAFLMAKKHNSFDEALQLVKAKYPSLQLYPSFVEQLKRYEARLKRTQLAA